MDLQPRSDALPTPPGPPPRYEAAPGGPYPEEPGLTLAELREALRRRAGLVLAVTVVVALAVAALVFTEAPRYEATAVVQVTDVRESLTGLAGTPAQAVTRNSADPLETQLQVLRSRSVIGEAVDRQGLWLRPAGEDPPPVPVRDARSSGEPRVGWLRVWFDDQGPIAVAAADTAQSLYGRPLEIAGVAFTVPSRPPVDRVTLEVLRRDEVIDDVLEHLDARRRPETSIIDVSYVSEDPERSLRVANAVVEQFAAHSARTEQQESRRRREFLEEQLAQVDSVLVQAQSALSDFRSREGIYSSRERAAAQESGLLDLKVRREELAADRRMYASLLEALTRAPEGDRQRQLRTLVSAPGIASNPVVSQLYAQMIRYELARDSLVTGAWGSARTNPDVERLERLLESTRYQLVDAVRSHMDAVDARIAALDGLESRTAADLQALPAMEAQEARLVQQVETVRKTADQLRSEFQEARIAEAVETGNVEVIDRADRPRPVDSRRPMKLALGLVLGLMLGSAGALVLENVNTSVRGREDVEQVLGIAPLGVVPRLEGLAARGPRIPVPLRRNGRSGGEPANGDGPGRELVALHDNRSSGAEAYRTLRTNLLFSHLGDQLRSVVVTSAGEAEGKTTVAANLATTFAQQGMRVLLVDCDLRKARLHELLGHDREPGLTEWLLGRAEARETVRETEVENLYFLPAGTLPPNPSELLGSPRMQRLATTLREGFELVLYDTPPLMAAGDAAIVGRRADGVLLVVRAGETEQGAAREAIRQLRNVQARVLGAVLNDPDAKVPRYGGGYYHYAYYGHD